MSLQFYVFVFIFAHWSTCALSVRDEMSSTLAHSNFHAEVDMGMQRGGQTSWMRANATSDTTIPFVNEICLTCLFMRNRKLVLVLLVLMCVCLTVVCLCCCAWQRQNALDKLDRYSIALIEGFAAALVCDPWTDDMLDSAAIDLYGDVPEKKLHIGKYEFTLICEDDCTGFVSFLNNAFFRTMGDQIAFPLFDVCVDTTNQKELEEIKKSSGLSLVYPTGNHTWAEMSSDEALKRYFFYGPGALYVRDVKAAQQAMWPEMSTETAFVADCSDMAAHDVRAGFRKYGALAAFDVNGDLLQIVDVAENRILNPSDDKHWEHGKHLLKQSFSLRMTADHLLNLHLGIANTVVTAHVKHLPPRHIIRRLLTPFTFNTTRVNNAAFEALFPQYSILHRTTGFTYSALVSYFERTVIPYSSCFQPFPEQVENFGPEISKLAATGNFPLIFDGLKYFSVVRCFVDAWVARGFASDEALRQDPHIVAFWLDLAKHTARYKNGYKLSADAPSVQMLVDTLTQFIWCVTGWHELVGNVVEFTDRADGFGLRARPFPATRTDLQSWVITASLVASTSLRMPGLMSRFPNYFEDDEILAWAAFQNDLEELAKCIETLNGRRWYEYNWFNPRFLECSASL